MTSENEKKGENKQVAFSNYLSTILGERIKDLNNRATKFEKEVNSINEQLKKPPDQFSEHSMLVRKSIAQTDFIETQDEIITSYTIWNIALHLAKLVEGRTGEDNSLDLALDKAKKDLDEHVAKRLGQLFDKDSKGYIG